MRPLNLRKEKKTFLLQIFGSLPVTYTHVHVNKCTCKYNLTCRKNKKGEHWVMRKNGMQVKDTEKGIRLAFF